MKTFILSGYIFAALFGASASTIVLAAFITHAQTDHAGVQLMLCLMLTAYGTASTIVTAKEN